MELETLFTEQKWNILKSLCEDKFSPLQLAQRSNTTIANISQQLRLLEAAELVKKEKVQNRDKGKPRTLFSLSHDYAYLISTVKDFAGKRLLELSDYHKVILRILFLENPDLHYYLSKFYWKIEDYLSQIGMIIVIPGMDEIKLLIVSEKAKEIEKKLNNVVVKKPKGSPKTIRTQGITKSDLIRLARKGDDPFSSLESLQVIYDPGGMLPELKRQKGGR
ncbi:helix-turn-helix domain-containing protein [Candidatus Woesearchaeota archaeon]|nr:helix-turn-helix domain-containing protein [Candidatus Woesearchaeota archaeon]